MRNVAPIDPADESWGVDSSSKESAAPPNLNPVVEDFEPDTQNLKEKKKDEARDLAMPPKKAEEEKSSYVPQKVPLIDPMLWKRIPIVPSSLVENAVDNKINNMIEDVLLEYHNIEKRLYADVKDINKSLKAS